MCRRRKRMDLLLLDRRALRSGIARLTPFGSILPITCSPEGVGGLWWMRSAFDGYYPGANCAALVLSATWWLISRRTRRPILAKSPFSEPAFFKSRSPRNARRLLLVRARAGVVHILLLHLLLEPRVIVAEIGRPVCSWGLRLQRRRRRHII